MNPAVVGKMARQKGVEPVTGFRGLDRQLNRLGGKRHGDTTSSTYLPLSREPSSRLPASLRLPASFLSDGLVSSDGFVFVGRLRSRLLLLPCPSPCRRVSDRRVARAGTAGSRSAGCSGRKVGRSPGSLEKAGFGSKWANRSYNSLVAGRLRSSESLTCRGGEGAVGPVRGDLFVELLGLVNVRRIALGLLRPGQAEGGPFHQRRHSAVLSHRVVQFDRLGEFRLVRWPC